MAVNSRGGETEAGKKMGNSSRPGAYADRAGSFRQVDACDSSKRDQRATRHRVGQGLLAARSRRDTTRSMDQDAGAVCRREWMDHRW